MIQSRIKGSKSQHSHTLLVLKRVYTLIRPLTPPTVEELRRLGQELAEDQ